MYEVKRKCFSELVYRHLFKTLKVFKLPCAYLENEQVLQALFQDDDSQTPPIPEGMMLNLEGVLGHSNLVGAEEDGEEDEEITFNFSLRQSLSPAAAARVQREREEPVPMAMDDEDEDEQMETEGNDNE